jgi:hypothetical protein
MRIETVHGRQQTSQSWMKTWSPGSLLSTSSSIWPGSPH